MATGEDDGQDADSPTTDSFIVSVQGRMMSASGAGYMVSRTSHPVVTAPPANLTGVKVEFRAEPTPPPPGVKFHIQAWALRQRLGESDVPDEHGLYVMDLDGSSWRDGTLGISVSGDPDDPALQVALEYEIRVTVFTGGPPDWSATAFPSP